MSKEGDFQVLNMKYKIKKIKKKQRKDQISTREQVNNIGKIETFEILNNNPKTTEGMSTISNNALADNHYEGIGDEDWEGGDDVNSEDGAALTLQEMIIEFLNKLYKRVITFNCFLSLTLVNNLKNKDDDTKIPNETLTWSFVKHNVDIDDRNNPFTKKTYNFDDNTVNDVNAVYNYICLLECMVFSYMIVYIWFGIIFYNYAHDQHNMTIFDEITREKFSASLNPFVMILFFCFEYSIYILDCFRWVLYKFIPSNTIFVGKAFCFIALFILIFFINYDFLFNLKNIIIDLLNVNYENLIIIMLMILVFGKYISSFFITQSSGDEDVDKVGAMMGVAMDFMQRTTPGMIMRAIYELIHLIVIYLFSIPFGIILCVLFFLWVSTVTTIKSVFFGSMRDNIIEFLRSDLQTAIILNTDDVSDYGIFSEIFNAISNFFTYLSMTIFNYLPFLILIAYTSYVIANGLSNINNFNVSYMLQVSNIGLLVLTIVLFLLYLFILTKDGSITIYELFILPPIEIYKSMTNIAYIGILLVTAICMISVLIYTLVTFYKEQSKTGVKNTVNFLKSGSKEKYNKTQDYVNKRIKKFKDMFK